MRYEPNPRTVEAFEEFLDFAQAGHVTGALIVGAVGGRKSDWGIYGDGDGNGPFHRYFVATPGLLASEVNCRFGCLHVAAEWRAELTTWVVGYIRRGHKHPWLQLSYSNPRLYKGDLSPMNGPRLTILFRGLSSVWSLWPFRPLRWPNDKVWKRFYYYN